MNETIESKLDDILRALKAIIIINGRVGGLTDEDITFAIEKIEEQEE